MSPLLRRDLLIVFGAVVVLCAIGARQAYDEYRLSRHSQSTEATVTSKRGGHGWIEYEYTVQGRAYTGTTPATATGKGFDEVVIGDKLRISFDPTDPKVSGTTETRSVVRETAPFIIAVLIIGSGLAYLRSALRE